MVVCIHIHIYIYTLIHTCLQMYTIFLFIIFAYDIYIFMYVCIAEGRQERSLRILFFNLEYPSRKIEHNLGKFLFIVN